MPRAVSTGNGAYRNANALHMALTPEATDGTSIPESGAHRLPTALVYAAARPLRRERYVPRLEIIDQTLALARTLARHTPQAPSLDGGAEALERLASQLRDTIPESLEHHARG